MKRTNSLSDLLMEELADLLNAEDQLIEVLPKMVEASQSATLKLILEAHWEVTKEQAVRLQDIFSNVGQSPEGVFCKAMKGFISESEGVVNKIEEGQDRDAAIIRVVQCMEQYEIIGYQIACEHAADLGHTRVVELLTKSLDEERSMYLHLNELAQGMINAQAIRPKTEGFYIPKGNFRRGGTRKKPKSMDVSRFISEGNPNLENPEEQ